MSVRPYSPAGSAPAGRPLSPAERKVRQRLKDDFPHYAEKCLAIRAKSGKIIPFALNRVQRYVHARAEAQLASRGRVRALVLKCRQPGISTLIEGRFYWKVTHQRGVRAYILTHRDQATANIFAIAKRFHTNSPPVVRPEIKASNATELDFGRLDSGYRVGTAKAQGVGRSDTIQYFHGSEVAFWANADEHVSGALEAVPREPGTEIWLESTANGIGGMFCNMWKAAERGDSEYIAIFAPWFMHEEYIETVPAGWSPPPGFANYRALHDLSPEQLYWSWLKNAELAIADRLRSDEICWRFRQEYPATAEEAFQSGDHESFIPSELVVRARRNTVPDQSDRPLILGVDIARGGGDKTRIIDRLGRCAGYTVDRIIDSADLMEVAGMVAREIDRHKPDMTFVDVTGLGAGVYDRLREMNYRRVMAVNFGAKAQEGERYLNKRAEIWGRMRDWLADPGGADLPDTDEMHSHLCAPGYSYDSESRTKLEGKAEIRKRTGFSPDAGDALALTFAEPVRPSGRRLAHEARTERGFDPFQWKR